MNSISRSIVIIFFLVASFRGGSQPLQLELNAAAPVTKIQSTMYGIFFEDINFAADGGLYAEMIKNRSFEFEEPLMGWLQPNSSRYSMNHTSGIATVVKTSGTTANRHFLQVSIHADQGYALINTGFKGMGVKKDMRYLLSFKASPNKGTISKVIFQLVSDQEQIIGESRVEVSAGGWQDYSAEMTALATALKAQLKITFVGTGTIDLDMISLFPEDTWKGRKKGLRKDLVQLLYDLHPGFVRFPGGCIVEGRTLAQRYQWKKTVGPAEDREFLINRWNTEFAHRPAPDYFQSFGLGFFEYFQLAEDLGAAPLPILSCGMACQFNTGELVPLNELDPYVQDALDLIEFANGPASSPWGKVRTDMGHPEPFNLKHIGVGNEQWGPEYIQRFQVFEKALKDQYPDIIIISGAGPFAEGEHFEYGMEELTKLNAEIIDEHYYKPPAWFKENATRYDNYDRKGPKIFAGEYAAQSVAITSPENENNWDCALAEAAFMTGLERNADVVVMTSYAPLMAHAEGWQWTPDLIWFNNLEAYGTANYYVQKLFANYKGTDLLSISNAGKALTGQQDVYASAVMDQQNGEIYLKLVNINTRTKEVAINLKGAKVQPAGTALILKADTLEAVNSFDNPKKVSPEEHTVQVKKNQLSLVLEANSFTVVRMKINQK